MRLEKQELNKNLEGHDSNAAESEHRVSIIKGVSSIVCYVGSSELGLLENYLLVLRGSKSNKSSEYHTEVN